MENKKRGIKTFSLFFLSPPFIFPSVFIPAFSLRPFFFMLENVKQGRSGVRKSIPVYLYTEEEITVDKKEIDRRVTLSNFYNYI